MKNLIKKPYLKIFIICIIALLSGKNISAQWTALNSGTSSFLYSVYFPSVNTGYACGINGMICRTTNGGTNWTDDTPISVNFLFSVYFTANNTGYIVGSNGAILKTTNGTSWTNIVSGTSQNLRSVYFINSNTGFAAGDGEVILKTTNAGLNWTNTAMDVMGTEDYYSITFYNSNTGWVCGFETTGRIRKTTDAGITWLSQSGPFADHILKSIKFYTSLDGIAVGDSGYIVRTTNGGTNWTSVNSGITNDLQSVDVGFNSGLLFHYSLAVGYGGKILRSTNNGLNWVQLTSGTTLNLYEINCLSLDTAFVVGGQGVILRTYDAGGSPTEIQNSGNGIPKSFQLQQNYPNPFNPNTKIEFGIPEQSYVSLKIYDITGRIVQELVNSTLNPGFYNVNFDAGRLSSGIYFYKLNAGEYSVTKKMSLVK